MNTFSTRRAAVAASLLFLSGIAHTQSSADDPDSLDALLAASDDSPQVEPTATAPPAAESSTEPVAAESEPLQTLAVTPLAEESNDALAGKVREVRSRRIEEITVTASFREQSVQDVVGGAQVFGGEGLDKAGAAGMEDYLLEVPSVSLQKSGNGSAKISIRGISNVNASDLGFAAGSPTTGVYLNDVGIQGSGVFPDLNLFDLNRIEVLKGPQGTLYGEGSMGGSIKMVTNAPTWDEWIFRSALGFSQTEDGGFSRDLRLAVNVPVLKDRVAARIVATRQRNGGYVDYTTLQRPDADSEDAESLRGVVAFSASETLNFDYQYFGQKSFRNQFPVVDVGKQEELTNEREEMQFADTKFGIHSLTGRWDLPAAQLTSVTALYKTDRNSLRRVPVLQSIIETQFNGSGVAAPDIFSVAYTTVVTKLDSISQELRLVSAGDERFDWIGGLFYRDRSQSFDNQKYEDSVPNDPTGLINTVATNPLLPGLVSGVLLGFNPVQGKQEDGFGDETFTQYAAYGELNFALTENIEITGGLRLFTEKIGFFIDTQYFGVEAFLIGSDPANIDPETGTVGKFFETTVKTQGILPKASVAWRFHPDRMVYATVSRGFRSGAANVYSALGAGPAAVQPDYVWNKEIGLKASWFDGQLVSNLAGYHIDWQAMQGTVIGRANLGAVPVDFAYLANAGDSTLLGAEMALNWATPVDGLLANLNLGYNDGKVTKPAASSMVVKGSPLPNSPRFTGSTTLAYTRAFFGGSNLELSSTYSYIESQSVIFETEGFDFTIPAYDQLKASVGVSGERWRVQMYGDNLLDNRAVVSISAPTPQYTVITPRVLGIRASYDF